MKTTKTTQVAMQWNTMDFPVLKGTPISLYGVIANDANAVGIVMEQINQKTDDALFTIMNGGIVDVSELDYSISNDAMGAIHGILFYQDDQRPYRQDLDVLGQAEEAVETANAAVETAGLAVESAEAAARDAADSVTEAQSAVASLAHPYSAESTYNIGDYVIYDGTLYRCTTAIPTAEAWTAAHWTEATLADDVKAKANPDGFYENMSVGNAEQLLASVYETDKVPYNFRTSGGPLNIGDRETDEIHGGSLAWNQLIVNGNFADESSWNLSISTVSGAVSSNVMTLTSISAENVQTITSGRQINIVSGHKVLFSFDANPSTGNTISAGLVLNAFGSFLLGDITPTANSWNRFSFIANVNESCNGIRLGYKLANAIPVGETLSLRNINCFDLTLMFGSQIADYIYTLEQSNAGAGVAWFRKLFPKPYYAYDAGSPKSVKTSAHRMTGFNQWDEEWEQGLIDETTGESSASTRAIRSKNFIPVIGGMSYYFNIGNLGTSWYRLAWYDASKSFISGGQYTNQLKNAPDNAVYMKFSTNNTYGGVYNSDICINLHWDGERDGEYEPYKLYEYALDPDLELRGIFKLDANNSLYCDGDVYSSDGTVRRRYGIVDLGTLNWSLVGTIFKAALPNGYSSTANTLNCVCPNYSAVESATSGNMWMNQGNINLVDSAYSTAEAFKTAMSGVYLIYELATETEDTAEPYTNPQIVDDWGTEEYVDEREVAVPVGHVTQYMPNLKAKVEMSADSPDADGDYILRHSNGLNAYVPLTRELPAAPSEDGTYTLSVTVSGGVATYSWVSA